MVAITGTLETIMAKPIGRPPKSTRDDVVARIDRVVIAHARFVADSRKIPLAQYLSEVLRPTVMKDFEHETLKKKGGSR